MENKNPITHLLRGYGLLFDGSKNHADGNPKKIEFLLNEYKQIYLPYFENYLNSLQEIQSSQNLEEKREKFIRKFYFLLAHQYLGEISIQDGELFSIKMNIQPQSEKENFPSFYLHGSQLFFSEELGSDSDLLFYSLAQKIIENPKFDLEKIKKDFFKGYQLVEAFNPDILDERLTELIKKKLKIFIQKISNESEQKFKASLVYVTFDTIFQENFTIEEKELMFPQYLKIENKGVNSYG